MPYPPRFDTACSHACSITLLQSTFCIFDRDETNIIVRERERERERHPCNEGDDQYGCSRPIRCSLVGAVTTITSFPCLTYSVDLLVVFHCGSSSGRLCVVGMHGVLSNSISLLASLFGCLIAFCLLMDNNNNNNKS